MLLLIIFCYFFTDLVLLFVSCSLFGLVLGQAFNLRESPGPSRQVEVFVNVYDHPKTGFTCVGKAAGMCHTIYAL